MISTNSIPRTSSKYKIDNNNAIHRVSQFAFNIGAWLLYSFLAPALFSNVPARAIRASDGWLTYILVGATYATTYVHKHICTRGNRMGYSIRFIWLTQVYRVIGSSPGQSLWRETSPNPCYQLHVCVFSTCQRRTFDSLPWPCDKHPIHTTVKVRKMKCYWIKEQ